MAGRIPSSFIDGLLTNSDIVEVISRFVPLQKKGHEYMACCPFHEEKTPSFSVSPRKQFYYCFGCGAGGSAVKFLMEHQKMDFVEAVETLARFAGVEVPREAGAPAADRQHKDILAALEKASGLYRKNLAAIPTAAGYLARRGIGENTAATFALGYAPPGFDNLKRFFGSDCNEKLLLKAGLLAQKENTGHTYDKFRNRLMFPIRDRQGRTIAFGGRVLKSEDQPKYLNSPETEVFHKRRTLYGAYELRETRRFEEVIVVEGYMDVVSLASRGVKNAVATLGTAVTREHIHQLFRLCGKLVFCFDGDPAGRKAAAAALRQTLPLFNDGRTVNFMFLPEGEDPDSFIQARGEEAVKKAVGEAVPLSAFMFDHLREELDLSLPEGRAAFAERARPMLAELPRGAFRDLMAGELAGKAGVEAEHLFSAASETRSLRPKRTADKRRNRYSAMRVAIARLLLNPALAQHAPACDEIRAIDHPGTALLADMLTRISQNPKIITAALLEQYRDSEHEPSLISLLDWPSLPDAAEELKHAEEFKHAIEHLRKPTKQQAIEKRIEEARTRELNKAEKSELQASPSRKPEAQQPGERD